MKVRPNFSVSFVLYDYIVYNEFKSDVTEIYYMGV